MSWLLARFYDAFMEASEQACLGSWRQDLLQHARGRVLEIGAGTGVNLPYYQSPEELLLLEPDAHMRKLLNMRYQQAPFKTWKILAEPAESLSLQQNSVDTVVSTLVLCTVKDPRAVLSEIKRVLKPGGQFIFLEHVAAAPDSKRFRWQRRLEPLWKLFAGGCHVTRDTQALIEEQGFVIDDCRRESVRKALPIVRPSIRGRASPQ